jgi:hypothetical protein
MIIWQQVLLNQCQARNIILRQTLAKNSPIMGWMLLVPLTDSTKRHRAVNLARLSGFLPPIKTLEPSSLLLGMFVQWQQKRLCHLRRQFIEHKTSPFPGSSRRRRLYREKRILFRLFVRKEIGIFFFFMHCRGT